MRKPERLLASLCVLMFGLGASSPAHAQSNLWVGTWAVAPDAAAVTGAQPVGDITYREIVHVSQGAEQVRVVLSNEFGTTPLTISSAHIAPSEGQSRIFPRDEKALTFGGATESVIPAGERLTSDPVSLKVAPLSTLAVSFYLPPQNIHVLSEHHLASQTNYVTKGNNVSAKALATATQITIYPILRTVEIEPAFALSAIACLGDSITDGFQSTLNANARWPNDLANRLIDEENFSVAARARSGYCRKPVTRRRHWPRCSLAARPGRFFAVERRLSHRAGRHQRYR